jgi:cob(I)alamin adenosyltransferase
MVVNKSEGIPGRVLLFTGDGKGKTTAALGMVLRAAGHGLRTLVLQFIKNDSTSGEIAALERFDGVELRQCGLGFIPPETHPEFAAHKSKAQEALRLAEEAMAGGRYDLIVLDEVCVAVAKGLIDEDRVIELVKLTPEGSRLALTGRGATERLIALADTATEMRCIKHGLLDGRIAQEGVEY